MGQAVVKAAGGVTLYDVHACIDHIVSGNTRKIIRKIFKTIMLLRAPDEQLLVPLWSFKKNKKKTS